MNSLVKLIWKFEQNKIPYYSANYEHICFYYGTTKNLENKQNEENYLRYADCHAAKKPLVKRKIQAFKEKHVDGKDVTLAGINNDDK